MKITVLSSMATRTLLAELLARYAEHSGREVQLESVGGVDAARRVQAGEPFDAVALAREAIDRLIASGHALPGRVDLLCSSVAVAVRSGAARPSIDTEDDVRQAVLAADHVGYSTGPSGEHVLSLFDRWGLAEPQRAKTVRASAGVPVAQLIARGEVSLGFQQLSELMDQPGVDVLGTLPAPIDFTTTFSAALCAGTTQPGAVRDMLAFLASADHASAMRRHGMAPAEQPRAWT